MIAPILRCSSVASILVAISDMRWFTTACTPSSMLSEPNARTFCTSSARMVSSSAMWANSDLQLGGIETRLHRIELALGRTVQ